MKRASSNNNDEGADNAITTAGFADGWMAAVSHKTFSINPTVQVASFISPMIKAARHGTDNKEFAKACVSSLTAVLRTSPSDGAPKDAHTKVSEEAKKTHGANYKPHVNCVLRWVPPEKNTMAGRKKWGTKIAKACNSMVHTSSMHKHPTTFGYVGDTSGDVRPGMLPPLASFLVDDDVLKIMSTTYSKYTLQELAADQAIIGECFGPQRTNEIAVRSDPSLGPRLAPRHQANEGEGSSSDLSDCGAF